MKLKTCLVACLSLALVGGVTSPSVANGNPPAATKIVACTDSNRGVVVCYDSASVQRGATTLAVETDFELVFQDESDPGVYGGDGIGNAGFVVRAEFTPIFPQNADPIFGPLPGDVGNYTIIYPRTQAAQFVYSGTGSALRGDDLATAAFAITSADDFTFTKELKTMNSKPVIEFVIDMTYITTWFRPDCNFYFEMDDQGNVISGSDPETGFSFPTEECETPNSLAGNGPNDSQANVSNAVSFYTPLTFDFVTAANDGGYLNYQGTGLSWFVEEANEFVGGAFQFQLVGPKFAAGTDPNFGAVQAFIPQAFMAQIFGQDFDPTDPIQAQRVDAEEGSRTVQDLVSANAVVTSVRNGGILIELPSYGFSAPGFSFSSTNRPPIESSDEPPAAAPAAPATTTPAAPATTTPAAPVLAKTGTSVEWLMFGVVGSLFAVLGALMVAQSSPRRSKKARL
jgi:hypothetical protein